MGSVVKVCIGDVTLEVECGQGLMDVCDAHVTPLAFGCRGGSCGTCLIQVIEGGENLSDVTETEEILVPALTDDASARLACQVRILGPVHVVPKSMFDD